MFKTYPLSCTSKVLQTSQKIENQNRIYQMLSKTLNWKMMMWSLFGKYYIIKNSAAILYFMILYQLQYYLNIWTIVILHADPLQKRVYAHIKRLRGPVQYQLRTLILQTYQSAKMYTYPYLFKPIYNICKLLWSTSHFHFKLLNPNYTLKP